MSCDNSDTVTVNITITDVNEPPAVMGTSDTGTKDGAELHVRRRMADNITSAAARPTTAIEPGGVWLESTAWSVAGADGSKFNIGNETNGTPGQLKFKAKPDYEMPTDANTDNVYEVTVRAADADRNIGTMAVKVSVSNENEDGVVTLSKTQPRVGVAVKASLTDPDGSISGLTWQWSIDWPHRDPTVVGTTATAEGANDGYLHSGRKRRRHADSQGNDLTGVTLIGEGELHRRGRAPGKSARWEKPPTCVEFGHSQQGSGVCNDQDTETDGVQNTETTRKVEENTTAIATDDDMTD